MKTTLSSRGFTAINAMLRPDFEIFFEAIQNLYHKDENPNGTFPLNVAENKLMWPVMKEKIESITKKQEIPAWVSNYTSALGAPSFRVVLAKFMTKHLTKCPIDPHQMGVSAGATAVIEMTSLLLGEKGDVVVFPAPCYPVYRQDIGNKSELERYDLVTHHDLDPILDEPNLSTEDLNRTLKKLQSQNKRFRILVLTNPDNPTGGMYSIQKIEKIADWCIQHGIHLIVNEIYGLSIIDTKHPEIAKDYKTDRHFVSFATIMNEKQSDFLHLWYSLSKDFGVSGFRIGLVYSLNEDFIKAYNNYNAPNMASNYAQWIMEEVLKDDVFVDSYIKENQKLLTESYVVVVKSLRKLDIPYVPSRGSLFIWADFSKYLNDNTQEAENVFWMKIYENTGILLTPGEGFGHTKHGQFRVVYPSVSVDDLAVALGRLEGELFNNSTIQSFNN